MPFKMKNIFRIYIIIIFLFACNRLDPFVESRMETAEKFVGCLKNNTPDRILEYSDPNVDHKIYDKESREHTVNNAFKLINKYGLPPKRKWKINYDPKNNYERLEIKIILFTGYDSTNYIRQSEIVIIFPPPQISDKIYLYDIQNVYDTAKLLEATMPTIPAPSIDTTKTSK